MLFSLAAGAVLLAQLAPAAARAQSAPPAANVVPAAQSAGGPLQDQPGSAPGAPQQLSLDGRWKLLLDPDATGEQRGLQRGDHPAWLDALSVPVPGPLEATSQTDGYDGVAWYRQLVPPTPAPPPGQRVMLCF